MNKTKFFYITKLDYDNVFKTQVISWLNLYNENKIDFTLIKLTDYRYFFSKGKELVDDEIRTKYNGCFISKYILPSRYLLFQLINTIILLISLREIFYLKRLVVQTRDAELGFPLKLIQIVSFGRLKIIFDARAAGAEEYIYSRNINKTKYSLNKTYNRILNYELGIISISDIVFSVSNNLRNYFIEKSKKSSKNYFIYPCSADGNIFYLNYDERRDLRIKYHLNDRIVLVYSGGFSMPWHLPEKILIFFKELYNRNESFYLIILTNDINEAKIQIMNAGLKDSCFMLKSVQNSEVRGFLSASDFGLLFRDNVIMNNVASPSKFAEYLMCGLPVIISDGVGDFTQFVLKNKVGLNITSITNLDFDKTIEDLMSFLDLVSKENISRIGASEFSKQELLPKVISQYLNISEK